MSPHTFLSLPPSPPLDRCVEALWYWEGPTPAHALERIMPTGKASLIINLHEDEVRDYDGSGLLMTRHRGTVLVGARCTHSVIDGEEQRAVIGVTLRAGGTWPLFGLAADELTHQHVGLEDLWGAAGRSLRDRILCAATPQARLQILATCLHTQFRARLDAGIEQHAAVAVALDRLHRAEQLESIDELSRQAGISARRLARLFSIEVGLTPKRYARVLRFGRVLQIAGTREQVDWQDLAQRCGYFDQAHFIHDFKGFSGLTPREYLMRRTVFAYHVRLHL